MRKLTNINVSGSDYQMSWSLLREQPKIYLKKSTDYQVTLSLRQTQNIRMSMISEINYGRTESITSILNH